MLGGVAAVAGVVCLRTTSTAGAEKFPANLAFISDLPRLRFSGRDSGGGFGSLVESGESVVCSSRELVVVLREMCFLEAGLLARIAAMVAAAWFESIGGGWSGDEFDRFDR